MKYHKIPNLFKLDPKTHKFTKEFCSNEVRDLQNCSWVFKDKMDWTNIRIYWNGYTISWKWRTDKSKIPEELNLWLEENLKEELFEECFWDKEVVLYWEWVWGKINRWAYKFPEKFVLFDILIGMFFLIPEHTEEIAKKLWIEHIEIPLIWNIDAWITYVQQNNLVEWLVWTPLYWYKYRNWKRIIVKIKNKALNDF